MVGERVAESKGDLAGVAGERTQVSVRVRYCECDPMGVAHHSVFPVWLEMARCEHLRTHGVPYRDLEAAGTYFVVAKMSVRFKQPVRYDDQITITVWEDTGPRKRGRIKVDHLYELTQEGRVIATAATTLVCVDRAGRPSPIPDGAIG